ncbi:type IV pilus biogenesis protein PilM (plasmid) [Hafnia alvei]|uniref:type IV pilus biogenesis protein PilM n=1 Tax=Hafnia alvei TaxID=569 RepID=UPI000B6C7A69|nr:type IV pilus biogenesis protein PilM [Hafnia alvei]MBI0278639.1 type IV pilus biogenesis protein PilM [Hafnia alvei]PNL03931.1 hypothetical protein CEQ28_000635 [Hafnia alvei]
MPWLFYCLGLFAVVIYGGSFSPLGQVREEQNIHNQLPQQANQTFTYLTALNDWRYSHPLVNGTIDARQLGIPLSNHLKNQVVNSRLWVWQPTKSAVNLNPPTDTPLPCRVRVTNGASP